MEAGPATLVRANTEILRVSCHARLRLPQVLRDSAEVLQRGPQILSDVNELPRALRRLQFGWICVLCKATCVPRPPLTKYVANR